VTTIDAECGHALAVSISGAAPVFLYRNRFKAGEAIESATYKLVNVDFLNSDGSSTLAFSTDATGHLTIGSKYVSTYANDIPGNATSQSASLDWYLINSQTGDELLCNSPPPSPIMPSPPPLPAGPTPPAAPPLPAGPPGAPVTAPAHTITVGESSSPDCANRMTANIDGAGTRFVYQNARFSGEDIASAAYPLVRIGPDTELKMSLLASGSLPNASGGFLYIGSKPVHFFVSDELDAAIHYGESGDWHLVDASTGGPLACGAAAQSPSLPPPDDDLIVAQSPSIPPPVAPPTDEQQQPVTLLVAIVVAAVNLVGLCLICVSIWTYSRRSRTAVPEKRAVLVPFGRPWSGVVVAVQKQQQPYAWGAVPNTSAMAQQQKQQSVLLHRPEEKALLGDVCP
jgi:hypothetical protein